MREKLLKSLRFTLKDAENWIEVAKQQNNKCWLDDITQFVFALGKAYQTALILKADYNENGPEVQRASILRYKMHGLISEVQEIHQEEKNTCEHC